MEDFRKMLLLLVVLAIVAGLASAQTPTPITPVDHWSTSTECLAATAAPFYHPTVITKQKLRKNEVVWGHPTGGCFKMKLPDRLGGEGWVKVEAGREFVYEIVDNVRVILKRMKKCNNSVSAFVHFPLTPAPRDGIDGQPGPAGPQGPAGLQGPPGPRGVAAPLPDKDNKWRKFSDPPPKARCGKGCKVMIGVGVAGGIVGGIFATREKNTPNPDGRGPGGWTIPAW